MNYHVCVFYRAKEGFDVDALTPRQAVDVVMNGVPGQRVYDEYVEAESIKVYDGNTLVLEFSGWPAPGETK